MRTNHRSRAALFIAAAAVATMLSAKAATTLVSSDFEGSLGAWTASGGGSLYTYSSGTNYAASGNGAADLPKSGGTITLTDVLPLDAQDYTAITISYNFVWLNGSSTRRLNVDYAADGVTFANLGYVTTNNGANGTVGTATIVLTESVGFTVSNMTKTAAGYTGAAFTDTARFRFTDVASAGADVRVYVDNISITGTPDFVPEPSAVALLGLGCLSLLSRRRR